MRPKSLILLSLALGCGLVASLGINQVMSKGSPAAAPEQDMEAIYVCSRDIQVNDTVTQDAVKLEQWPKSKIPPDAIRKLEDVVGRRARDMLQKADILRNGKLLEKGAQGPHASYLLTPGYRGIAVQVDAASTAGNLLKPGDHVDVLVFVQKNPNLGVEETKTVTALQDVKVFAVNATITNKSSDTETTLNARTVTMELLPEQCELLNMAKQLGQITLAVRSPKDTGARTTSSGAKPGELMDLFWQQLGRRAPAPAEKPDPVAKDFHEVIKQITGVKPASEPVKEKPWQLLIYRGGEVTEYAFDKDGEFDKDGKTRKSSLEPDIDASEGPSKVDRE